MPQVKLVQKMANLPTVTPPKEIKIRQDFRETFMWRDVAISKYVNALICQRLDSSTKLNLFQFR